MALEQQVQNLVNVLNRLVSDGSLAANTDALRGSMNDLNKTETERLAQQKKIQKAEQEMAKDSTLAFKSFKGGLRRFVGDIETHSALLSSAFQDAADKLDYDNFELLPTAVQKEFEKLEGPAKKLAAIATSAAGVYELNQNVDDLNTILSDWQTSGTLSSEQLLLLGKIADKAGLDVAELSGDIETLSATVRDANEARAELTTRMRGGGFGEFMRSLKGAAGIVQKFGAVVAGLSYAFADAARPAARFGTELTDSLDAFMAGMNPEEMAQNMAEYRMTINASGMGMDGFRKITEEGTLALTGWTGELRDAVRVQASAFGMARRFGAANQAQMQSFMDTQVRTFKQFNSVFSMTAEEFVAMNKQLEASQSVNEQIYRLNRQQRVQYAQDIQQTVLRLRTMGLMQEQAMKVVDAMAAIGAKSPKERMKEAAKLQAVGGALGFGQAAEEMATIMRRGMRGPGDMERFAELQKEAQGAVGARMGQGFASELMTAQMLETTGLESLLGPKSDFADLNTEQYKEIQNLEDHAVQRNQMMGQALGIIDTIQALLSGPIVKALATIAGAVAMAAGGSLLQSAAASLLGGGGLKAIFGTILRFLGPAGIIASIVGMVGTAAYAYFNKDGEDGAISGDVASRNKAIAAYQDKLAVGIEAARKQALASTGMRGNEYGRLTGGFLGADRDIKMAGGQVMDLSDYKKLSKGEQEKIDLAYQLERMEAKRDKLIVEEKTNADANHSEMIDELKKQISVLEGLQQKIEKPLQGIKESVDEQTDIQSAEHKEALNKSNNTNRLRWTLAG